MIIGIDCRMINSSGIGVYIKNMLRCLSQNKDIELLLLGDEKEILRNDIKGSIIQFNSKIYSVDEQRKFPYDIHKEIDILHIPHYNIPYFYKGKLVTTIHDIIHLKFPEFLPNKMAYYYSYYMLKRALKISERILTVSENTKADLIKLFNVDEEKIVVTYNGIDKNKFHVIENRDELNAFKVKLKLPLNKNIILYVGNKKPHKNLERLIEAFDIIKDDTNSILVLTGKSFESYDIKAITKRLEEERYIYHTGFIDDNELVYLYNIADVFAFPSLYEGFGLPPLEAMASGTPVVASNASSLPEVTGDAALLFDPYNVKEIAESLRKVLKNEYIKRNLVQNGKERINVFSWERTSGIIEKCYYDIYNRRKL